MFAHLEDLEVALGCSTTPAKTLGRCAARSAQKGILLVLNTNRVFILFSLPRDVLAHVLHVNF
jgi:hypothetical protein